MTVKHGRSRYTKGCRCDICRAANAEYARAYQLRRQAEGYQPDPTRAARGRVNVQARWGVQRMVRLDELNDADRWTVLGLVDRLKKAYR